MQRTAPTKPTPWHQYKNTLINLPAFLRDSTVPAPTIEDKVGVVSVVGVVGVVSVVGVVGVVSVVDM